MTTRKPDLLQALFEEAMILTDKIKTINEALEIARNAYMATRLPYPRDVMGTQEEHRQIRKEFHDTLYSQTLINRRRHTQMLLTNIIGRIGETAHRD
ncbi:MAG: hypothetical protein RR853_09215 [Aurantimicrobium sp.]|uniref:hypothetical protein n=1 Tax=Aurantimicrobium sp. TaxID=1930784 RepID=UPI002FC80EA1